MANPQYVKVNIIDTATGRVLAVQQWEEGFEPTLPDGKHYEVQTPPTQAGSNPQGTL